MLSNDEFVLLMSVIEVYGIMLHLMLQAKGYLEHGIIVKRHDCVHLHVIVDMPSNDEFVCLMIVIEVYQVMLHLMLQVKV